MSLEPGGLNLPRSNGVKEGTFVFTVKQSVTIDRPVEEVFAYVSDPANIPEWRSDVLEVKGPGGSIASGSTFEEMVNFMGRKSFTMQVIDYQPDHREVIQAVSGSGVRPTQTFRFKAVGAGTQLDFSVDIRTYGLFRLMEPMLPGMIRKTWSRYLTGLKEILEDRAVRNGSTTLA